MFKMILSLYTVLALYFIEVVAAVIKEVNIKESCGKHIQQNMTDSISYVVTWDGKPLSTPVCSHSFTGHSDIYTICFEIVAYQIGDCNVQLVYSEAPGSSAANFTCDMIPGPWCATPGSVAHLEIHGANTQLYNTTGFQIMVVATSQDKDLYIKLGIVIGVVLVVASVFGILLFCIRRRSDRESQISPTGYTKFTD